MVLTNCAICTDKQKLVELYPQTIKFNKVNAETFSARRTPDRMHYRLVKCVRCGLIFSSPILEPKKIKKLYERSSFAYENESKYLKDTYRYYLEKALKGRKLANLKLLEIGCGNGFFLKEVQNMGIKSVYGIEPSKSSVKEAPENIRKNIKVDILKSGLFRNNSFDIICCFHTLDHIPNPNKFIKICFNLLKKNGLVIFIVHNTDGLSVKLFGEKSAIFDIEHIYLFNPKSLRTIFKINNFKIDNIINVKNRYPLNYWFRMVPLPNSIKSLFLKLFDITYIGKIPVSIKPGNIGIVAKK